MATEAVPRLFVHNGICLRLSSDLPGAKVGHDRLVGTPSVETADDIFTGYPTNYYLDRHTSCLIFRPLGLQLRPIAFELWSSGPNNRVLWA